MTLGSFAHSRSWEATWNPFEASRYPSDFDTWLVSCIEATVELGRKRLNDGAGLANRKHSEVPKIFVEDESISLSEANLHVHQILTSPNFPDLEESPVVAPGKRRVSTCSPFTWSVKMIETWPIGRERPTYVVQPVSVETMGVFVGLSQG